MNLSSIVIGILLCVVLAESKHGHDSYENTYANCITPPKGPRRCSRAKHGTNLNTRGFFRTIDGTCNNLGKPTLGSTNTILRRMIRAQYDDKVDLPRGHHRASDYYHIPTAHEVSSAVFTSVSDQVKNDKKVSAIFMTVGQFLDHDLSIAPHEKCNVTDCSKDETKRYPCMPIKFDRKKPDCFGFARSKPACKKNPNKPRDHINELTAFIDLSQVYGTTTKKAKSLRKLDGSGELLIDDDGLLPIDEVQSAKEDCKNPAKCHLVGDERGEENIALFAMHTVWVRQHNRIAKGLKKINPYWHERQIYQTARKINGALWQHIVYNEYLPHLIDLKKFSKVLRGGRKVFKLTKYKRNVDPRITNVFSAAAFRFGHSLVPNSFSLMGPDFNKVGDPIKLQKAFFNSTFIYAKGGGISPVLMGLCRNMSNTVDHSIAHGIKEKLFVFPNSKLHNDLMALNVQRGRDHGIPTYMNWRRECGFSKYDKPDFDFYDLTYTPKNIKKAFAKVYKHVEDIDLFPGALTEHHFKDKMVGPTLNCIFKRQFEALRFGDRFFYTHKGSFTRPQLKQITKISLSKILCNTLHGMVSMQTTAFNVFDPANDKRVSCDSIPDINLKAWKDRSGPFGGYKF